jgi:hypothetical protein
MKAGRRCDGTKCTDSGNGSGGSSGGSGGSSGGNASGGNASGGNASGGSKFHHPPVCKNPLLGCCAADMFGRIQKSSSQYPKV